MGHMDGLGVPVNVLDLCPIVWTTLLADCGSGLHQALQRVWQWYDPDPDFATLDDLVQVLM